jgi:phosphoribosylformylglycinamidine synthase
MSEINCYDMAGVAIDSAIRNAVAAGGNINHMALMDNFCWCSSDEPERLYQLKDAARGCYEFATTYKTPFISGKDSMFNDFKGFDDENNQIKISVYPTLMISSIGVIEDIHHSCSVDFKIPGDIVYVVGETKDECGGGEFYNLYGEIGSKSPKVDAEQARKLYERMYEMHTKKMFSACSSVERGGLLIAIAKMSIAGQLGAEIDLTNVPGEELSSEKKFYSESQSRFVVSIDPANKEIFKKSMQGFSIKNIGEVKEDETFTVKDSETVISTTVEEMDKHYKQRFKDY